jgi:RecJ-like exonuclease
MISFTTNDGEYITLDTKYEVCPVCNGHGTHVNPNIDDGGIPARVFIEDPEFKREYFSGMYDVVCSRCKGQRVVEVPSEHNSKEDLDTYYDYLDELESIDRMYEAERRMGA